jgi:hypothetical protein
MSFFALPGGVVLRYRLRQRRLEYVGREIEPQNGEVL